MQKSRKSKLTTACALALQIAAKRKSYCPILSKTLNQRFYDHADLLERRLSASAWSMTLTFGPGYSTAELWSGLDEFIVRIHDHAIKTSLFAGALFSLEVHRKSSLTSKRGSDSLAGRPHIHAIFWSYNDFIPFEPSAFRKSIHSKVDTDLVIKRLSSPKDVAKNMSYVLKESGSSQSKRLAKAVGWEQPALFVTALDEMHELVASLLDGLRRFRPRKTSYDAFVRVLQREHDPLPPVARGPVEDQLKELFFLTFQRRGLAVHKDTIYKRKEPFKHTWEVWCKLSTFATEFYGLRNLPLEIRGSLTSALQSIARGGRSRKDDPILPLLPQVEFAMHLVEFPDGVFDLVYATMASPSSLDHRISCGRSCTVPFHELQPPFHVLELLEELIDKKSPLGAYGLATTLNDSLRLNLLQALGQLFHPTLNRKEQPFLALVGKPNSYKSSLIKFILDELAPPLVHTVSHHRGRFQFGDLPEHTVCLFLDDVDWDNLNLTQFQNLADAVPFLAEEKFKAPKEVQFRGSIATTSNKYFPKEHREPLESRALAVQLKPSSKAKKLGRFLEDKSLRGPEVHGLTVLANLTLCASRSPYSRCHLSIPANWLLFMSEPGRCVSPEVLKSLPKGVHYFRTAMNFISNLRLP